MEHERFGHAAAASSTCRSGGRCYGGSSGGFGLGGGVPNQASSKEGFVQGQEEVCWQWQQKEEAAAAGICFECFRRQQRQRTDQGHRVVVVCPRVVVFVERGSGAESTAAGTTSPATIPTTVPSGSGPTTTATVPVPASSSCDAVHGHLPSHSARSYGNAGRTWHAPIPAVRPREPRLDAGICSGTERRGIGSRGGCEQRRGRRRCGRRAEHEPGPRRVSAAAKSSCYSFGTTPPAAAAATTGRQRAKEPYRSQRAHI
mmetsp:Transcript_21443/g.50599  ORF Transcript_21443/g.50599 Transcript_21443/m.50599 type:complete len:258 (-) Transcript_21443:964-1737(-)